MTDIAGFPYFEVQFTKKAAPGLSSEPEAVKAYLKQYKPTDLFVVSHGWRTEKQGARSLYLRLFEEIRAILDQHRLSGMSERSFAVLGVLWPSKQFAVKDPIASAAASLDISQQRQLTEQLDDLADLLADPELGGVITDLKLLLPELEDNPVARTAFVDHVRQLLNSAGQDQEDGSTLLFEAGGEDILQSLSQLTPPVDEPSSEGGAASVHGEPEPGATGGATLLEPLGTVLKGAAEVLNFATYYVMKTRAGSIGQHGLRPLLRSLRSLDPGLKLHLIGHSFGGRLMAACLLEDAGEFSLTVQTLTLLQAAFSHHGFAEKFDGSRDGFFRRVITDRCISGPTVITHTKNDKAVGIPYRLASALAKDNAAGLGNLNDNYGAIGSNGALKTPEAIPGLNLLPCDQAYNFQVGRLHNLQSDAYIAGHDDICKPEVASAILSAVAMS